MKYIFSILILTAIIVGCRPTYYTTETIFDELPNGALLVRLKTNQNTLKALELRNNDLQQKIDTSNLKDKENKKIREDIVRRNELINKITTKRNLENQSTIDAFSNFNYCPVFYFYSSNSKAILDKKFDNIILDENLNPVKELPNLDRNYLIAEFSQTSEDTITRISGIPRQNHYYTGVKKASDSVNISDAHYTEKYKYVATDKDGNITYRYDKYNGVSMEGSVDALVLLSPDFVQLQSPYPHYVRTFEGFGFLKRSKSKTVINLQDNIEDFIKKK